MEIETNYNLPLKLNCLIVAQAQDEDRIIKKVTRYIAIISWEDIYGVEEFIKDELFPIEYQDTAKCILISKTGNHILQESVEQIGSMWGYYKIWKSKQVIKPLFSIN